jgi:hypothetical protein
MKKDITLILLIISLALVLVAVTFTANAQAQARSAGSPIGGIVVKGGQNGIAITEAKPGNPIGGIIVKGGHNGIAADVQPQNPLYSPSGTTAQNPLFQGMSTGQPIGGIVVKGGQNPRPALLIAVPGNGKPISEKDIK